MCGGLFILNAKPCTATVYVATVQPAADRSPLPNVPTLAYAARSKTTTASVDTWHRRLGHANRDAVKKLERQEMVRGMEIHDVSTSPNDSPCSSCLHGKQTRMPIPRHSDVDNPRLLHRVHSDLCGPMCTTALTGEHYFSTFTDAKSHHVTMYLQKGKDETLSKLQAYVPHAETITGER